MKKKKKAGRKKPVKRQADKNSKGQKPGRKQVTPSAVIAGTMGLGLIGLGLFGIFGMGEIGAIYLSLLGGVFIAALLWSYR